MQDALVFTDGASRSNPGPAGWGAVVADENNVTELGGGIAKGTNNQMELQAVVSALEFLTAADQSFTAVHIYSDSTYTISGATAWIHGWKRRSWQTKQGEPVKNKQLWQQCDRLQAAADFKINFHKVKGHASIPANERADDIATSFADGETPELYQGPRAAYEVSLNPEPQYLENSPLYFSLIDGQAYCDDSWDDCRERVSGTDAKYKKIKTVAERDELLAEWGVSLEDVNH